MARSSPSRGLRPESLPCPAPTDGAEPRHLTLTASLVDAGGAAVAGAGVSLEVRRDGALYASVSGTTGTNGTASFSFNSIPSGTYTTVVTAVSAAGLVWDGLTPANTFTKP